MVLQVWLWGELGEARWGVPRKEAAEGGKSQMANHMEIMKTDEITSPLL